MRWLKGLRRYQSHPCQPTGQPCTMRGGRTGRSLLPPSLSSPLAVPGCGLHGLPHTGPVVGPPPASDLTCTWTPR